VAGDEFTKKLFWEP